MIDVVIVGAGPVGATVARLLASKGFSVEMLEEHREVGRPVHCAGLVSPRTWEMLGKPPMLRELRAVRVHSPKGRSLEVRADGTRAIVIDRQAADKLVVAEAVKAGAGLELGFQVSGVEVSGSGVRVVSNRGTVDARLVVGADGASSAVGRCLGMSPPEELLPAFGCDLAVPGSDGDTVDVWIGNEVAPGFFAWAIPSGTFTRYGLAVTPGNQAKACLLRLLEMQGLEMTKALATYGGLLPIGPSSEPYGDRTLMVGDAAGHVKPLSGGGLFPGLTAAKVCADVASVALEGDDLSKRALSVYAKRLEKELGSEIARAHLLRAVFRGLSDDKLDSTLQTLSKPSAVAHIAAEGDIDFPSRLSKGLLAKCPGLLGLAPGALKGLL